jgi:hypothetical protein
MLVAWWLRRGAAWFRLPLRLVTVGALAYMLYPTGKPLLSLLALVALAPQREQVDRGERLAVIFALSVFWVNVGGLVAVQMFLDVFDWPVLFVVMNRGMRFAIFAAYLLLAVFFRTADWPQIAARVRRVDAADVGRWARAACVGLLIVALFWQLRGTVRNTVRARESAELSDLNAVAQWAMESTDSAAVFLFDSAVFRVDSAAFRVMARRSVVFSWKDIGVVASFRPDRSAAWAERRETLRRAGSDPDALWNAGIRFGADYVVMRATAQLKAEFASRLRYDNATYFVFATNQSRTTDRR